MARPRRKIRPATKAKTSARQQPASKIEAVIAALRRPKGATLTQLMTLTGWQMHSLRGALSGALKKQRGLSILSQKVGEERVYRIEVGK